MQHSNFYFFLLNDSLVILGGKFESFGTENRINNSTKQIKFILKVGVEESIVNTPLVSLQSKNANNAKSEVRFNSRSVICNLWCVHNRLCDAYVEDKFK
jgi:hypothetical protein